jgi:hypothetical protein
MRFDCVIAARDGHAAPGHWILAAVEFSRGQNPRQRSSERDATEHQNEGMRQADHQLGNRVIG